MVKISVKVKPNAKADSVEKLANLSYVIRTKSPAREGKANEAVVEALSDYFSIPKSRIKISHGLASKNKTVNIS